MKLHSRLRSLAWFSFLLLLAPFTAAQERKVALLLNLASPDSIFSTDVAEQKRLKEAGWKQNAAARVWSQGAEDRSELHRMVRTKGGQVQRLFTGRADEIAAARADGFVDEGVLGYVALRRTREELVPVYRLKNGEKFLWLIDSADRAWAEKAGWTWVGEDFWVLPAPR